ncbi:SemiSWEET transporter [Pedobacter arcticus]|uniref:SemiSWEET transporter n=1 Tax=Pedobacter arcticus TaxID=752140 RepID=UPI0009FFF40B|nr:SemiSWEET transporter [Pedobacter arcticus]
MKNLSTVIGLAAAFCTTVSFVPQALKIIRTKNTKSISLSMYLLFVLGVTLWLIYGIWVNDLPVTIANGITLIFAGSILYFKLKYP